MISRRDSLINKSLINYLYIRLPTYAHSNTFWSNESFGEWLLRRMTLTPEWPLRNTKRRMSKRLTRRITFFRRMTHSTNESSDEWPFGSNHSFGAWPECHSMFPSNDSFDEWVIRGSHSTIRAGKLGFAFSFIPSVNLSMLIHQKTV